MNNESEFLLKLKGNELDAIQDCLWYRINTTTSNKNHFLKSVVDNINEQKREFLNSDWIIKVQLTGYYTNESKNNGLRYDNNIDDAIIFKNKTKEEVENIAKEIFKDRIYMWEVVLYEESLSKYKENIPKKYIILNDVKYEIGECTDAVTALNYAKEGGVISYEYGDITRYIVNTELKDNIKIDIVLNARWRLLRKID